MDGLKWVRKWTGAKDCGIHKQKRQPVMVGVSSRMFLVARGGIEPPTQGFSILCSTN